MTGARLARKSRPLPARVVRDRMTVRLTGVMIMLGGAAVAGVAAYCALGYDAANVTADPRAYAQVISGVAGLGLTFMAAGVVAFLGSWRIVR